MVPQVRQGDGLFSSRLSHMPNIEHANRSFEEHQTWQDEDVRRLRELEELILTTGLPLILCKAPESQSVFAALRKFPCFIKNKIIALTCYAASAPSSEFTILVGPLLPFTALSASFCFCWTVAYSSVEHVLRLHLTTKLLCSVTSACENA